MDNTKCLNKHNCYLGILVLCCHFIVIQFINSKNKKVKKWKQQKAS